MKKNVKLDMAQIKEALQKLSFLKSYSFLLLPVIIIIVAILVYIPTPIMNSNLQQKIQKESIKKGKSLENLSDAVVSKDQWLQVKKSSDAYTSDVNEASELVIQSTQRELISYNIFPEPKDKSVAIFKQFGQQFQNKLEELVKSAGGGNRPTDVELGLSGRGNARDLRRPVKSTTQISDKVRDALCFKRAQTISFYFSIYDLMFYNYWSVKQRDSALQQDAIFNYSGVEDAVEDCWYTQIGYWIIEDVISTIKAVNGKSASVYTSPIKRIIDFDFSHTQDSQSSTSKVLPGYVTSSSEDDYDSDRDKEGALTFTGRSSKDGIDVVYFNMSLAMDSAKMLSFMKELCSAKKHSFMGFDGKAAKRNFKHNQITILDADFEIIDRDSDEHKFYRYGDAAVVELVLSCEYVFSKKGYYDVKPVTIKQLLNEEIESELSEGDSDEQLDRDMRMRPPKRTRRSRK